MNLDEYKIFHELAEVFKKAAKLGSLRQLLVDQRDLKLRGYTKHYEWTLSVKKVKVEK